jgi:hypothetical protein
MKLKMILKNQLKIDFLTFIWVNLQTWKCIFRTQQKERNFVSLFLWLFETLCRQNYDIYISYKTSLNFTPNWTAMFINERFSFFSYKKIHFLWHWILVLFCLILYSVRSNRYFFRFSQNCSFYGIFFEIKGFWNNMKKGRWKTREFILIISTLYCDDYMLKLIIFWTEVFEIKCTVSNWCEAFFKPFRIISMNNDMDDFHICLELRDLQQILSTI